MTYRLLPALLLLGACAAPTEGDACEAAAAHVLSCTGTELDLARCDAESADAALALDCEALQEADGKADCSFFNPWSCWGWGGGGGGGDPTTGTLTVNVQECINDVFGTCAGTSAIGACTQVVVEDAAGDVVAEGLTSSGGNFVAEGLARDAGYRVRVLRADGSPADVVGEHAVTLERAEQRVYVELVAGELEHTRTCAASIRVPVHATDAAGAEVEAEEIEWGWLVEATDAAGVTEIHRAIRFYEATENVFAVRNVAPGTLSLTFHRVAIPADDACSWYYVGSELRFGGTGAWHSDACRLPNRNGLLLEHFATGEVERYEVDVDASTTALDPISLTID